jgi:cell division protein FtsI/penicillin-binding protein 2
MKKKPVNWFKVRIFLIVCVLFLCFVTVVARMFQLQVLRKDQLYKLASRQHEIEIPLVPKRGAIMDRKGNDLAVSIEVDSLYADPRKVKEVDRTDPLRGGERHQTEVEGPGFLRMDREKDLAEGGKRDQGAPSAGTLLSERE